MDLRRDGLDRGSIGRSPVAGRTSPRRPRRSDVFEPPGIPGGLSRLRLDGGGDCAAQHGAARHPAQPHPAQLHAEIAGDRAGAASGHRDARTRCRAAGSDLDDRGGHGAGRCASNDIGVACSRSGESRRPLYGPATRSRSSIRRAPRVPPRACAVRRRRCSGGASIRRVRLASSKAMSCSRRCRSFTPTH